MSKIVESKKKKSFAAPSTAETAVVEKVEEVSGDMFATFMVELPSLGKVYPKGHPLAGKEEIEMRHMTAREEDILTSPTLLRSGKAINKVLQSCVVSKVNVDSLLVGDRNALLLAMRISGYGPDYKISLTSESTGEQFEHTFDLTDVEYASLKTEPAEANQNLFETTLPVTQAQVLFKLLTVANEATLMAEQDKLKKITHIEKGVTTRLKAQIVSVDGDTDLLHIKKFVENMPVRDSRHFRTVYLETMPDVDMTQWVTDPTSGEEVKVDIPVGVEFLWPSAEG
jgi:hypothetical protein|tara:strand:- start:303 stop:1151 length:849 start_codon:yes stop_codon:yes gene_type:complete